MARKELVVEARQVTGKKVAALRRAGILPGNIFGKGIESESIQLQTELLEHTLKAAVANEVIDLKVGNGTARPVVIHKIRATRSTAASCTPTSTRCSCARRCAPMCRCSSSVNPKQSTPTTACC